MLAWVDNVIILLYVYLDIKMEIKMNEDKKGQIQSVARAIQILECFNQYKELGVSEINKMMELHKSTTFGLICTLKDFNFLEQDKQTGKYKLGNEIFRLGTKVNVDLRSIASPYLDELVDSCHETANLVVRDGGTLLYLKKVESPYSMRICTNDGEKIHIYCTAVGKAILAYLEDEEINDIINNTRFTRFTDKTITDRDVFLQQLKKVRQNGYAEDFEEREVGLVCVAAPIFDHDNKPIAGLSVSGPATRMTDKLRAEIAEILQRYTLEISRKLGY